MDFDKTWVNTVAKSMCQVVMNIGKGKSIDDNTALLNIICEIKSVGSVELNYAHVLVHRIQCTITSYSYLKTTHHRATYGHPKYNIKQRIFSHFYRNILRQYIRLNRQCDKDYQALASNRNGNLL